MMFWQQLFARKSIEKLNEEMKGDNRLRRVLGPVALTALGVGAIIGAGIFVMTGRVSAADAGPGVMVSFTVAGIGCLFAALCYAEFAALAPVAGSAYTYAYATLGELLAWIIGWDLILEYAMAGAVVASGWSKYFNEFLITCGLPTVPDFLIHDPFSTPHAWFNLPAALIILLVTVILVIGIRESAGTNAVLVGVKVGVVLLVILVGAFFVTPAFWTTVPPSDRLTAEEKIIPETAREIVLEEAKTTAEPDEVVETRVTKLTLEGLALERLRRTEAEAQQALAAGQIDQQQATERLRTSLETVVANYADRLRRQDRLSERDEEGKTITARNKAGLLAALTNVVAPEIAALQRDGKLSPESARQTAAEAAKKYTALMADHKKLDQAEAEQVTADTLAAYQRALEGKAGADPAVKELIAEAGKQAPGHEAKRWGVLGLVGLNHWLQSVDDSVRSSFFPYGLSGMMLGASLVFFAFIGFDSISTHSEEAVRPQRDVPIGILASLAVCTLLYVGVAAVITGMVRFPDINQDAALAAAFRNQSEQEAEGSWMGWLLRATAALIAIGAIAGMTSVLLITFLSQARIFLAMARDKLLPPRIFGVIHPKFKTPHVSTMLTGGVIAVVAAVTPSEVLEEMVSIGTLMAFVIVCAAVLLLRVREPNLERPFKTPWIWFVAPAGVIVNLTMTLFLPWDTWLRLLLWLALGLVIYFAYSYWNSDVRRELRAGQN